MKKQLVTTSLFSPRINLFTRLYPQPTGLRWCNNGVALTFIPKK